MTSPPRPARLKSLDSFRGVTIAGMILVNNPGSLADTYAPLRHADWNGWTFADVIFPFFLWIAGVSMTLSSASRMERGESRGALVNHAVRRAVLLFACGVALAAFSFPVAHFPFFSIGTQFRLTGILQKIAVCYLAAFLISLWTDWRGVIVGIIGLNLAYLGLMFFYPVPGCGAGSWSMDCNFARYIDEFVLKGHMWHQSAQDPDGLGSILPAISTVLFGVLAGDVLRQAATGRQRTLRLLGLAAVLVPAAAVLAIWIPINKPLWTTSYAVLMSGLASLCFAIWYWVADVQDRARWFKPLEIYGMNAVAAFVVSVAGMHVPRLHVRGKSLYTNVCLALASPANASLLYALLNVLGVYVVVWWMYRRRIFLKF